MLICKEDILRFLKLWFKKWSTPVNYSFSCLCAFYVFSKCKYFKEDFMLHYCKIWNLVILGKQQIPLRCNLHNNCQLMSTKLTIAVTSQILHITLVLESLHFMSVHALESGKLSKVVKLRCGKSKCSLKNKNPLAYSKSIKTASCHQFDILK